MMTPFFTLFIASLLIVAVGAVDVPCVTTNAVNTNCNALNDTSIYTAVDAWIDDPATAVIVWGNITDW